MWLPKGKRTNLYVDRKKARRSFLGALSLTTKKMKIYPIEVNQSSWSVRCLVFLGQWQKRSAFREAM